VESRLTDFSQEFFAICTSRYECAGWPLIEIDVLRLVDLQNATGDTWKQRRPAGFVELFMTGLTKRLIISAGFSSMKLAT
jgi:hypothetical protein